MGQCEGTNTGLLVLNLDELPNCFQGWGYLLDANKELPATAIFFRTVDKTNSFRFQTSHVRPIHPDHGVVVQSMEEIKHRYSADVRLPNQVEINGILENDTLSVTWKTDIKTEGKCNLVRSRAGKASELTATNYAWDEFKTV